MAQSCCQYYRRHGKKAEVNVVLECESKATIKQAKIFALDFDLVEKGKESKRRASDLTVTDRDII